MVVGGVDMEEIEPLPLEGFGDASDVAKERPRADARRKHRPGPSRGIEPPRERALRGESDFRFDSGRTQGADLIEGDGRGSGPFRAGDQMENAHRADRNPEPVPTLIDFPAEETRMAVDPELLAILVCPKTKGPLEQVSLPSDVRKMLVDRYREKFRDEEPVVEVGLFSPEASLVYPIVSDIPVMLIDEALPASSIGK